ncbi:MAG: M28 family metallopeptidase [Ignavibacteriae bacterium]|nr:M28 family metallopeptidase [Ignavibacteriota bacterium]
MLKRIALLSLTFLFLAPVQQDNPVGPELYRIVQGIEGLHDAERLSYIKKELNKLNVIYRVAKFDTTIRQGGESKQISGENIVVRVGRGGTGKHVVVGAHSDAVPNSPGANDNGGGVAVLIGLIKTAKQQQWNFTIDFCFFDREEDGLIGSAVFVRNSRDKERHLAMINLDVEGTGEEVYVGPVGKGDDNFIMPLVREAARQTGFAFEERSVYPPSDYQPFAREGLENISISIVPKGDADKITDLLRGTQPTKESFPEVLKVMHTERDSAVYVTPSALAMSHEFTKTVLMLLNESQKVE